MEQLAFLGGAPIIENPLPQYQSIGDEEEDALSSVIRTGILSGFYGSPGPEFMGGPQVQAFEAAWRKVYNVKAAISVNSNTSGLIAALGAIGLSPGDEVIVPPYTMSATVVSPLFYGGIPVFVDIEQDTFCLNPTLVEQAISPKTRAIIAVNLFGHPAQIVELRALADRHGIYLIEDTAQAPMSFDGKNQAGTVGHIGVFSLNYHKHIHTGEGGVCVTNDIQLAQRIALIRNHGENVVSDLGETDLTNMIGFNFRMTEMAAAIGCVQLKNIDRHISLREHIGATLSAGVMDLHGITPPKVRENCRHNYYCWCPRVDEDLLGISRDLFSRALKAEGFPHEQGYIPPLYMLPVFQERIAIGRDGYPFNLTQRTYKRGLCPTTERLYEHEVLMFEPCAYQLEDADLRDLVAAFQKVHSNLPSLQKYMANKETGV